MKKVSIVREVAEDSRLIRLSEILLRSNSLLKTVNTIDFEEFVQRYSAGVSEGVQLIRWFVANFPSRTTAHNTTTYSMVLRQSSLPNEHHHIALDDKLSIIHQLEQILARWTVRQWVIDNKADIIWLIRRSQFYPLILSQLALTPMLIDEKQVTLPSIKIDWLIDLAYPLFWSKTFEDSLATALCQRQHFSSMLNFTAQIDRINFMMSIIKDLITLKVRDTLTFLLNNTEFFSGFINERNIFRPAFVSYVEANTEATALRTELSQYSQKMVELLQPENGLAILENEEKLKYFSPQLRLLISNAFNGRLPMLVELANVSSRSPELSRRAVMVLIWLENYREIIRLSFNPQSGWHHWLEGQPAHQPVIKAFSEGLMDHLAGFELLSISDLPADKIPLEGKIYLQKVRYSIRYLMKTPRGELVDAYLPIRCTTELTGESIHGYRPAILAEIAQRGQTLFDPTTDVRPAKRSGNLDNYPSAKACFMDCLSGLEPEERGNDLGCVGPDVLLKNFMFDPRNVAIVAHFERHIPLITPVLDAYNLEQARLDQQMMAMRLQEGNIEVTTPPRVNTAQQLAPSPVQRVARKPRGLSQAFEEAFEEQGRPSASILGM